jgi:hypothetical protein
MPDTPLTSEETQRILRWLGAGSAAASRAFLDAVLAAYGQHVPWESASRVVRRASGRPDHACVATPRLFWEQAMMRGLGGTCFESNAALAALLEACGIACVRTINDRPPIVACHTALIVTIEGERLVVDAGFPLYAAVPLPVGDECRTVETPWGTFTAAAAGPGRFSIGQQPHPRPLAFELVDRAVPVDAYDAATCADYGAGGLFLDRVIVKKIVNGDMWRFASGDTPWVLEWFRDGTRRTEPLPDDIATAGRVVAEHFAMDVLVVQRALELVGGRRVTLGR